MSIVERGKAASRRAYLKSNDAIERAKNEIKTALRDPESKFVDKRLTVAAVLSTAKLSPTFLEKPNRAETKLKLKKWVSRINSRLVGGRLATSRKGDAYESLLERFEDLQNSYAAASIRYADRDTELAEARKEVDTLKSTVARLDAQIQALSSVTTKPISWQTAGSVMASLSTQFQVPQQGS